MTVSFAATIVDGNVAVTVSFLAGVVDVTVEPSVVTVTFVVVSVIHDTLDVEVENDFIGCDVVKVVGALVVVDVIVDVIFDKVELCVYKVEVIVFSVTVMTSLVVNVVDGTKVVDVLKLSVDVRSVIVVEGILVEVEDDVEETVGDVVDGVDVDEVNDDEDISVVNVCLVVDNAVDSDELEAVDEVVRAVVGATVVVDVSAVNCEIVQF